MTELEWLEANRKRLPYMPIDAIVHEAWQAARATAEQSAPEPLKGDDQRDAFEWAIQASCFETSDRARSARRVFEEILAAVHPDANEAFSLADELDEISERITRFSNSAGDGTTARAAQLLRELASLSITDAPMPNGWKLIEKRTHFELIHEGCVIASLAGPNSEANAAIIARALKSQQDAAIVSKPAEQSLDSAEIEALRLLYREAVYWRSMQSWSGKVALKKAIAAVDAAIESQRRGDGS